MQTADSNREIFSTFFVALLVVVLGTAIIDPSRLSFLLIPVSFLLAAHGVGLLFQWTGISLVTTLPSHMPMLRFTLQLGMGISLVGTGTTVLGIFGLYRLSAALIVVGLAWSLTSLLRDGSSWQRFKPTYASFTGGLAIGTVWCLVWLWATIPPTFYDELAYHLPIAQYALETGTLPALPWSFFTYMPHLSDLLLGWGMALGGDIGTRSMHVAFWIAVWMAAWALVESVSASGRPGWTGYLLAGACASSATFLFLGVLPFAETSLAFAVLASAALIAQPGASPLWLPVGFLWGLAISVKLSGLSWVIAGASAALVMGWPTRALVRAGLVTLVTTLPWWGRAWWLTGNPLYPLGYRWIGGLYWDDASQARLDGDLPSYDQPFNALTLFRLPYDMVMASDRFGSASDCGPLAVAAACLLLTLPLWPRLVTLDPMQRRQCYAAGLFVLIAGTSWVMTSTTTRFFAPALLIGLSTLVALLIKAPKAVMSLSIILLTALGVSGTVRFLSVHSEAFSSQKVALGKESGTEYAARTVDHYEAAAYVREHLPPTAHVLFIGESRPFYFARKSLAPYPFHEHPLAQWIAQATSPEELRDRLRNEGFTHVVLNTREFKRLHDRYQLLHFTGPQASLHDQRLKQLPRTLTTLFAKNTVYVFAIPLGPSLRSP